MGDLIQLTPFLAGLAERWGVSCDLLAAAAAGPRRVLANLPFVAEVVTLESRRTPYPLSGEQQRLVAWLRRRAAAPVYAVEDLPKVFRLLARGGVAPDHLLSARDLPRGDTEHAVAYHRRLLAEVPVAYRSAPPPPVSDPAGIPRLAVSTEEVADCRSWLADRGLASAPLVVLQTQSRRTKRGRWPDERWRALASAVLDDLPAARLLLVGSPAEAESVARVAAAIADPRAETATADLPLRRLFALLSIAHSCVSLDTGPAHAAAALGCPLVVVVGMADPCRNRPLGAPGSVAQVTAWPEDRWPPSRAAWETTHRIEDVAVEPVVAAWRSLRQHADGR